MPERDQSNGGNGLSNRTAVYCLIPQGLAPKLHALLREHFRDDPGLEVVVEKRRGLRRSAAERRRSEGSAPGGKERRLIRNADGRRAGERRAALLGIEPADLPALPRRARRYASGLAFMARVEPSGEHLEDLDTARLVIRFQAGEREAFTTIYTRYFDRVYGYLLVTLADRQEAEDATQEIFLKALEAMSGYERRAQPFRAWLFRIARNHAVDRLRHRSRVEPRDPTELRNESEAVAGPEDDGAALVLSWISDRDLVLFFERRPLAQRQALVLRYTIDLSVAEIAEILDRNPADVRMLISRGLAFLRERPTAAGRGSVRGRRARIRETTIPALPPLGAEPLGRSVTQSQSSTTDRSASEAV